MVDTTKLAPQAHALFHQKEYEKAIGEFSSAIARQAALSANDANVFALKNDQAVACLFGGKLEDAISLLNECETFYSRMKDQAQLATVYANLAAVYDKKKKVSQGITYYLRALDHLIEADGSQEQKYFMHYELSKLYLKKLNFVKVYAHYVGAISYKPHQTVIDKLFLWITTPR